jgi:hypothetical protein
MKYPSLRYPEGFAARSPRRNFVIATLQECLCLRYGRGGKLSESLT